MLILAISGCSQKPEDNKSGNGKAGSKTDKPIAVLVAPITHGSIADARHFSGSLKASNRFVVASRVSGTLKNLHVDIGDSVVPGQLLAELDDAEFKHQFNQAKAELAVAKASVTEAKAAADIAKVEFKRAQSLRKQKIASQSEWDQAKAESQAKNARVDVARAQLSQRQAALDATQVRLGYARIEAHWNGSEPSMVVGQRYADEGDLLNAHSQILTLVALGSLKAVFEVTEKDYLRIAVGQPAILTLDAYPDRHFDAQVTRVSPVLDPQSRQAQVEVKLDNPDGLLSPGMFVRVSVELSQAENTQLVPVTALINKENSSGLYLVNDDQTVRYVEVVTGIKNRTQVQIIKPKLSGSVVTLGQHLLKDGAKIQVQGSSSNSAQPHGNPES
jgi:RND family efflux transporter MFP subunit